MINGYRGTAMAAMNTGAPIALWEFHWPSEAVLRSRCHLPVRLWARSGASALLGSSRLQPNVSNETSGHVFGRCTVRYRRFPCEQFEASWHLLHLAVAVRSQVVMKEFCAAASQYSQAKADLRNIETRLAYGAHKALEILGKFREGQHLLCNDL